ncbi:phospholipase D-like domain-containing protein [Microvirga pudoricolor]|uniref:phospholipase D-like domain-containing protein n=1 Tax=Microvirga pudoricolor TaxID=2778729 RepID=UPI00194FAF93|nr:phospholipase D-like domain-containing protein [Microvirga pudoricolor]MBM6596410.1 hypothetical protein [Microvirga pudoricolor]
MSGHHLVVQPDHGVEPVIRFLRSATSTALIKQFTFNHPALLDEVLALHERGVKVRVLLNGAKATGERLNDDFFNRLKERGIDVAWSNPAFLVTHEKTVVVDSERALIATFNFMEKYFSETRDYGVFVSDPAMVSQIVACFERDWNRETYHPHEEAGLGWSPGNARHVISSLIDGAHHTLDIQHPKFAEPLVFERIAAAVERGVKVRVLCGGKHGLHQPDMMYSFALWNLGHRMGARVHKQKNLRVHAKLIVADGKRAFLGSQNLDQPAFDLRREVGVLLHEAKTIQDVLEVFETDWRQSVRYEAPYPLDAASIAESQDFEHDPLLAHD